MLLNWYDVRVAKTLVEFITLQYYASSIDLLKGQNVCSIMVKSIDFLKGQKACINLVK